MLRRTEDLPELKKMQKATAVLWCVQVNAVAQDGAEVNGGGGARAQRHREVEDGDEKARGESERDPWPYLLGRKDKWHARESRRPKMDMR